MEAGAAGTVERTLALIKPDAVRAGKAEEIKQLIELHGFTIIAQQKVQVRGCKGRGERRHSHVGCN
jgi:nucleoside diphosphate kinase